MVETRSPRRNKRSGRLEDEEEQGELSKSKEPEEQSEWLKPEVLEEIGEVASLEETEERSDLSKPETLEEIKEQSEVARINDSEEQNAFVRTKPEARSENVRRKAKRTSFDLNETLERREKTENVSRKSISAV